MASTVGSEGTGSEHMIRRVQVLRSRWLMYGGGHPGPILPHGYLGQSVIMFVVLRCAR